MTMLLLAGGLLAAALLVPGSPGIPLRVRYRRLGGTAAPTAPRRRLLAWVPAQYLLPLLPEGYRRSLRLHLLRADLAGAWPLPEFVAVKVIACAALALLMVLYWAKTGSLFFALAIPIECVSGWMLPDFWVKRRAADRLQAVQRELPHLLGQLAVCLHTGLSLRSALVELADLHQAGRLGHELRIVAAQLRNGANPGEALAAMTERCGAPELTQALGSVLQHVAKGSRAAGAAAAAAANLAWQRRRRRAEAIAHTASLKLFLPQLLLGFPALFLILLGPVFLRLWAIINSF